MEKIGYTTNLLYQLDEAYNIGLQLSKTELAIERNIKLKTTTQMLIDISKISNIETIINAERIILRYESGTFGNNNPQANKSISEAIKELDSAYKTYLRVLDKDKYQIANDTHSIKDKDRKNGLPKDAFHKFINSHKTRLGNRIRTFELSSEERQLLNQRKINMKIALNEYMKLQAISLNIAPNK